MGIIPKIKIKHGSGFININASDFDILVHETYVEPTIEDVVEDVKDIVEDVKDVVEDVVEIVKNTVGGFFGNDDDNEEPILIKTPTKLDRKDFIATYALETHGLELDPKILSKDDMLDAIREIENPIDSDDDEY